MTKQRIGYDEYQEQLETQRKAEEAEREEQEREIEEQKRKEEEARSIKAQKKLEKKKKRIIARKIRPFLQYSVLRGALIGQIVGIALGSAVFGLDKALEGDWDPNTNTETKARYHTYGEAIKSAYGMGDWEDNPFGVGFDSFMNLLITCVIMGIIISKDTKDKKEKAKELFHAMEKLKVNQIADNNLTSLVENLNVDGDKILESLSRVDRSYFEAVAEGKINKNYERCVAIILGYLKAHPKEYEEVIKVIDEAVLPESIRKKYGAGKITSFAAAKTSLEIKR